MLQRSGVKPSTIIASTDAMAILYFKPSVEHKYKYVCVCACVFVLCVYSKLMVPH